MKHSTPRLLAGRTLTALWLFPLATGCAISTSTPVANPPFREPASLVESPASYAPREIHFKNAVLEEKPSKSYLVRHIRFPSAGDNGQPENLVTGLYYETRASGAKPLVIVLPIWGGHPYPAKKMATHIRRKSRGQVNVFVMSGDEPLFAWLALGQAESTDDFLDIWRQGAERERTAMIDVRRLIDWAEPRSEVDPRRIAVIGFSHSAVLATSVAPHEPRLAAVVSVMGGAKIHEILATCPLKRSADMRQRSLEGFGWTTEVLADRLEPIFRPIDASNYPGRVDPKKVLLVEATRDECMPETSRRALFEAMGGPETVAIRAKHQRAFLALTPVGANRLRGIVWRFLENRFGDQEPIPAPLGGG